MAHFVRFIFVIVAAGIAMSLGLVMFSDLRSQHYHVTAAADERKLFDQLIERYDDRLCRGDIAVEWQKISATGEVLETSVLVRRYTIDPEGKQEPLPIKRIILPGGRVCVDGLALGFDALFNEEFKTLRNVRLNYLARVYCEQQPRADRFSFLQEGQVPDATRVHRDHVTHYEERLWQYLWDLIDNPDRAEKQGLKVRWEAPACRVVKNGMVYSIFAGEEGVSFNNNDDPSLLNDMLREVQERDQERGGGPADSAVPVEP